MDNEIKNDNEKFILDPLSVIIKLAILSNKPVGTKILISSNVIFFQEPGMFQALCRYVLNSNKDDLQYMYNPIQIACQTFLTKETMQKNPRFKVLFVSAQSGIEKLKETYKQCSMICLCLNYYNILINSYVEQKYNATLFQEDAMTSKYTKELTQKLNSHWTDDKLTIILDLISFLTGDKMASNNVKSLENLMESVDSQTQSVFVF
jgi:hypothetical protein